jgi:hypothetical protein
MAEPDIKALVQAYTTIAEQLDHRTDELALQTAWARLVGDPAVSSILDKTMLAGSENPSRAVFPGLGYILSYVKKESSTLAVEVYEDVVKTSAEVVSCEIDESEDIEFVVKYCFIVRSGERPVAFELRQGYDLHHCGYAGWSRDRLVAYWAVGKKIPCRYRASDPSSHAILTPFEGAQGRPVVC